LSDPAFSDLVLGIVIFTFLAVPASLLLLLLADVIRLEEDGVKRSWIRRCLWTLGVVATVPFGMLAWGWAGAAHLQPLCQAYATPEYRATRPFEATTLLLEITGVEGREDTSAALPAWTRHFGRGGAPALFVDSAVPVAADPALSLEVRRVIHHRNLWFEVTMDRFRLVDRQWGTVLAEADEIWVDAGRARHHCGIISGASPVSRERTSWPDGVGVARFVERGLRPTPVKP